MIRFLVFSLLFAALAVNLFFGTRLFFSSASLAEENNPRENLSVFVDVLETVADEHVGSDDFTYQQLVRSAIDGMLDSLDPYSEFMAPSRYEYLQSDAEGKFGGVGIVITIRDGQLTVVEPMDETPAIKVGVIPGDKIIEIDGESTVGFQLEDSVRLLRGKPGTDVRLTLERQQSTDPVTVTIKRAEIKVHKVKDLNGRRAFPLLAGGVGYVRLQQFDERASGELEQALEMLEDKGMSSLILDLRSNPGGLLDQAIKVTEKFIPKGELIVSTEGPGKREIKRYTSSGGTKYLDLPLVVLVNRDSASASEIVAGCLKDLGRAVIVGEKTFGKGLVQRIIPLRDGSAFRLTTSEYYTPSHTVINGQGIEPDITILLSDQEKQALFLRRIPGGEDRIEEYLSRIPEISREEVRRLVKVADDRQLNRAADLLRNLGRHEERMRDRFDNVEESGD